MNTVKQQEISSQVSCHSSSEYSIDMKKVYDAVPNTQSWKKPVAQVEPQRAEELEVEETAAKKPCYAQNRTTDQTNNSVTNGLATETFVKQIDLNVTANCNPPLEISLDLVSSSINNLSANNSTSVETSQLPMSLNNICSNSSEIDSNICNNIELKSSENGFGNALFIFIIMVFLFK